MNAILYVDCTSMSRRYLPHDVPPQQSVYGHPAHWRADGIYDRLTGLLQRQLRPSEGRTPTPPHVSLAPKASGPPPTSSTPTRASTPQRESSAANDTSPPTPSASC
ncbi:hypothetical protein [Streptomyces pulveraceus]|uniref:Transposase n=1 Tax=Streptomyces pulveraceus TaxID=68258 RepID=A0ABW1GPB5_9ACTN